MDVGSSGAAILPSSAIGAVELRSARSGLRQHLECFVQDAPYFRAQARIYLGLAEQMSDPKAAETFRVSAADSLAKAVALEDSPEPGKFRGK